MILSRKAKEATKTALAMTMAYGIAMSMGWDKSMWAGFAVAMCSLATIGQSLNKAAMRMFGTLTAVIVALTLIALFPQQRWLFMIALSCYIGFCTYMMGGTKNKYFWHVCGFVCVIICMSSGPNSANAFQVAMLRAQETGLGILVYSLVSICLWPKSSRTDFMAAACQLTSTQHQRCKVYLETIRGQESTEEIRTLSQQAVGLQTQFNKLLDAAETDSYEVWEVRKQWRGYQHQTAELGQLLNLMDNSLSDTRKLDLQHLFPNLIAFGAELDRRLEQIERMLSDRGAENDPNPIDLTLDKDEVRSLSHFSKAVIAVFQKRCQRLEVLTRSMFETVCDIKGMGGPATKVDTADACNNTFVLDPDRVAGVIRVVVTVWLAYLAWIYIDGIPGGVGIVIMTTIFAMAMATTPQIPVSLLCLPNLIAILSAGVIYIFLMPKLSGFWDLGVLIFIYAFAIGRLFAAPRQALGRVFGLSMFITITAISNVQNYSFLAFANTALMFQLGFALLIATAYVPFSPRPELAFLRLQKRFFNSCDYLMSTARSAQNSVSFLDRFKKNFHIHEIATLPEKLSIWAPHIGSNILTTASTQQVQALVANCKMLSGRLRELLKTSGGLHSQLTVKELNTEITDWRLRFHKVFQSLIKDPAAGNQKEFQEKLAAITARLEASIKKVFQTGDNQLNKEQCEDFYCLMDAYQSLSESLVDYAGNAGMINWTQWQEERF
jgi:uncharacterized membrane protein YccC